MRKRILTLCMLLCGICLIFTVRNCGAEMLPQGAGSFSVEEQAGANAGPMNIFYYRPSAWTKDQPVVVVFHGLKRDAEKYRDDWIQYAEQYDMLVICPEFSEEKFPGVRYYNTGNVSDTDDETGTVQPKDKWVFSAIDDVIKETEKRTGVSAANITLFAHSAGAQMLHRYILFDGSAKVRRFIPANAGWYTMPDRSVDFPYGIKNVPVDDKALQRAFAAPVTILLGGADTQRSKILRKTTLADAQGMNRFERGNHFFAMAKQQAGKMDAAFNWQIETVPGVGHNDALMAGAAAKLIADDNQNRLQEKKQ